ncbi:mechanosensitive ion channel [Aggregatimonas sangjinii]|uniref:Mechanosensitive ion channel n=1 Tax=Aggregatimonas sangjinii TaxID=2583587 RepID=A0A5B7SRW3_9FLAO|nr:mechanosensitive ion channel domain-containing protein [Aggregatimonas sangjinii]QCW99740.1 mechanosensitive ion channel [Aggregatimonas sangjinii]
MEEFFLAHRTELLYSLITLIVVFIFNIFSSKAIRKVGKIGEFNKVRTNLIVKYLSAALTITTLAIFTLIWGVNFKDLGVMLSSIFAVIGVALFAQWSILSNITAGVIIFFSYPFKIGNTIRIMDKEINDLPETNENIFVIEDIRAFHLHLRKRNGEILTYPNSLVLQKGVALVSVYNEEFKDQFEQVNEGKVEEQLESLP